MLKKIFDFILELVKVVLISLVIIIPVRYFLIQPFYVKGASMEPNFFNNEYLIIDELTYRFKEIKRGDIVVFRYPRNPQEYFIKRIIGLPGESVQIREAGVHICNQENPECFFLEEDYLGDQAETFSLNDDIVEIGEDEYFVLGDNRMSSKDSRTFGPINESFIIGRALLRGWPLNRIGFIENH